MSLCLCGCGKETWVANRNDSRYGWQKGISVRYVRGHGQKLNRHHSWNGGMTHDNRNHILIRMPKHPRSNPSGYVPEHILLAEKAYGKPLPPKAVVHHADSVGDNNQQNNLVICEDQGFHLVLHRRRRAFLACGHANWRKCKYCKQYDAPENLYIRHSGAHHQTCSNAYRRGKYPKKAVSTSGLSATGRGRG